MSPHSGTEGEGQPLSRTRRAVLLVGVEVQIGESKPVEHI